MSVNGQHKIAIILAGQCTMSPCIRACWLEVLKQNFAMVSAQVGDYVQVGLELMVGDNHWHDTGCSNAGGAALYATAFTQKQVQMHGVMMQ